MFIETSFLFMNNKYGRIFALQKVSKREYMILTNRGDFSCVIFLYVIFGSSNDGD